MSFKASVIDVSVYQGNINWPTVKSSGIYAAVVRAGYGREVRQEDAKFAQNYTNAAAVDMPLGAYWFSYAKDPEDAVNEARACLTVLAGRKLQLPLYFDQEENSIPAAQRTACAVAFMDFIRANSAYMVGYYTYAAYFSSVDIPIIQQHCDTIWLADYRQNYDKTIPRDMHQYTSSGSVPGISGRVDMNHLYRDFVSETGGIDMDLSADTYKIGPVSGGDRKTMMSKATELGIPYEDQGDYIIIGPASEGDRKQIVALATSLLLGVQSVIKEPEPKPAPEPEIPPVTEGRNITITCTDETQRTFFKALATLMSLKVSET